MSDELVKRAEESLLEAMNVVDEMRDRITVLEQRIEALEEKSKRSKAFKPPTVQDVFTYMVTKKEVHPLPAHEESAKFVDFYESKNWYVGKTKMKSWQSACNNWIRRNQNEVSTRVNGRASASKFDRAIEQARVNFHSDDI